MCVRERERESVCVCVCVREREREREREPYLDRDTRHSTKHAQGLHYTQDVLACV